MGEYNALLAAEVFDFKIGLEIVAERGRLMSLATSGAMLAVIGCGEEKIAAILQDASLQSIDVANFNTPKQIVLSGKANDIKRAQQILANNDVTCIPLKVSGAFHSRYMRQAADQFSQFLQAYTFQKPKFPVVANVNAKFYEQDKVASTLVSQLYQSVKWTESIRYLLAQEQDEFIELGERSVLTNMVKEIKANTHARDLQQLKQPQLATNKSFENIGSGEFKADYHTPYPYIVGSMGNGISSQELVVKLANKGILAYFGSAQLALNEIDKAIETLANQVKTNTAYGVNVVFDPSDISKHQELIDLCLQKQVRHLEISGFNEITEALVEYRVAGIYEKQNKIVRRNKILAKTANSLMAAELLTSPPSHFIESLLQKGKITRQQARLSQSISMVDDICVEGDGGWRSSNANALILLPQIIHLRNTTKKEIKTS